MKKIIAVAAIAAFALSASVCFAQAPAAAPAAKPAAPAPPPAPPKANKPGVEVPEWEAKTLDGDATFGSAKLKGKSYALVFVNSSCAACRDELATLSDRQFSDKFTVLIAAVDVKPAGILAAYREKMKLTYPIIDDSKFTLARKFGIGFTPASVIVGTDGKVEAWFAGYTDDNKDEIIAAYEKYLAKK